MGKTFVKFNKKSVKICLAVKNGANSKNLGGIVIPKARGAPKSLFRVSTQEDSRYEH